MIFFNSNFSLGVTADGHRRGRLHLVNHALVQIKDQGFNYAFAGPDFDAVTFALSPLCEEDWRRLTNEKLVIRSVVVANTL